jgi:Cullin protein neddylation domain
MMEHQALIREVVAQISTRFIPKTVEIRRGIENLLQKDYIEHVEGRIDLCAVEASKLSPYTATPQTFRYLP